MAIDDSNLSGNRARSLHIIEESLRSKHGQVVASLATELLSRRPGEHSLRVQEYASLFNASAGTVQSALNYLQAAGGARLEGRGRRGTLIRHLHYPLLWSLAVGRPIIGVMPLPYTKRFEGLATGIRSLFSQHPIDLDLRFMRGAITRLQFLSAGECDWVVLSQFAAKTAHAHGFEIEIVMTLELKTYMADHVLLLPRLDTNKLQDGMRVGIDPMSTDHTAVVRSICRGKQVKYVEINYSQGLDLIRTGIIDATVWSQEDVPTEFDDLTIVPLVAQSEPILDQTSEAAIVVNRGSLQVLHVLEAALRQAELHQIQQDVVQKRRLPSY